MERNDVMPKKLKILEIKDITWKNGKNGKNFYVPGYGKVPIDIQTISDETLKKIMEERSLLKVNIPKGDEIIKEKNQSFYYKKKKKEILSKLKNHRFSIISGPTGTGKTTLAKTIAYELQLELYEVGADREKTVDDFAKSIKTFKKGNILQIKEVPGDLLKALTGGGIYLINEANVLAPDIQLALANMIESDFVIIGNKKYKVHPNFSLIFTSNDSYAGTNSYNNAVIRKAGGIVEFNYEPDIEGERKLVSNLYEKIKIELKTTTIIDEQNLNKIADNIRKLRETIRKYNNEVEYNEKILSQDLNDIWHFLYVRFYEKLIKEILQTEGNIINLQKLVKDLFLPYVQDVISGMGVDGSYISHNNDIDKLKKIIDNVIQDSIYVNRTDNKGKHYIDSDIIEFIELVLNDENLTQEGKKFIKEEFDTSLLEKNTDSSQEGKNKGIRRKGINLNLFKKVLNNEVKSYGEKLKRVEKIEELAQDMYEKLVETHREKIIEDIKIVKDNTYGNLLKININGEYIFFKVKEGKDFDFDSIKIEKDVLDKVFGNEDLEIVYDDEIFENIFSHPKSLEVRRYSKQIEIEKEGKNYIVFLGFKGEIRDIRYVGEESGNFYIPQSKVNELLLSIYEVLTKDEIKNIDDKKHYLALNKKGELIFGSLSKLNEIIGEGENIKILKKTKNNEIERDIRERFKNLDKLNLYNGIEEKAETGTPTPIIGRAKPLQAILEETKKNFYVITEKTKNIIDRVYDSIKSGEDIMLVGPSGVGKTSIVKEVAKHMNLPYIDLQVIEDFEESNISSKLGWNEGELEDIASAFLDFYINGGIVELKELNMAMFTTFLHNFMDKNGGIKFQGKIYKRHPDFHIIATVNPFDNRIFHGTKPLNLATMARFKIINVDYLGADEEVEAILKSVPLLNERLYNKDNEKVNQFIDITIKMIVYPIREKIDELRKTQTESTDEILQILIRKNLTMDTILGWIKNAQNAEELKDNLKEYYSFSQEEKDLLISEEGLNTIISILESL